MMQAHADKGWAHYEAMQRRVDELKQIENHKRERKYKWLDRIITFIIGLASGLILMYLKHKYFP